MNVFELRRFELLIGKILRPIAALFVVVSISGCAAIDTLVQASKGDYQRIASSKYFKTTDAVYFWRGNSDTVGCHYIVPKADPATFTPLGHDYGKDAQNVFFEDIYLECADPNSFQVIGDRQARDKNHTYSEDQIKEADGTFLSSGRGQGYVIDAKKNAVYYQSDGAIDGADAKTFVPLSSGYAKDRNRVYFEGQPISADPTSFKTDGPFGFDRSGAWFKSEHINGLANRELKVLGHYITDGKRVFYGADKYAGAMAISDAEVPTDARRFRSIGGSYGADSGRLYFQDLPVFRKIGSEYQPVKPNSVALTRDTSGQFLIDQVTKKESYCERLYDVPRELRKLGSKVAILKVVEE